MEADGTPSPGRPKTQGAKIVIEKMFEAILSWPFFTPPPAGPTVSTYETSAHHEACMGTVSWVWWLSPSGVVGAPPWGLKIIST